MKITALSKFVAEFLGTLVLVFLMGGGTNVIASSYRTVNIGFMSICSILGILLIIVAYAIDRLSGCHINPAISIAMVIAERMELKEAVMYIIAQVLGALSSIFILMILFSGKHACNSTINNPDPKAHDVFSPVHYSVQASFIAETLFVFIFLLTILGLDTARKAHCGSAGIAIGLSLVLIQKTCMAVISVPVNPKMGTSFVLSVDRAIIYQQCPFIIALFLGCISSAVVWRYFWSKSSIAIR
jgi:aquaporin Z